MLECRAVSSGARACYLFQDFPLRSGTPGGACHTRSDGHFCYHLTVDNRIAMLSLPGRMGAGSRQHHTTVASLVSKGFQLFFRILRLFPGKSEPRGILRAVPCAVKSTEASWALITSIYKPSPRNKLSMCFYAPRDRTRFWLVFILKRPSTIEII